VLYGFNVSDLPALQPETAATDVHQMRQLVRVALAKSAQLQIDDAAARSKPLPTAGDRVFLSTAHLKFAQGRGTKLVPRWVGPFLVKRVQGTSCELDLPANFSCRRVWNVKDLKLHRTGDLPVLPNQSTHGFDLSDLVPEEIDPSSKVAELYFDKRSRGTDYFRVKYEGYSTFTEVLSDAEIRLLPNGATLLEAWLTNKRSNTAKATATLS